MPVRDNNSNYTPRTNQDMLFPFDEDSPFEGFKRATKNNQLQMALNLLIDVIEQQNQRIETLTSNRTATVTEETGTPVDLGDAAPVEKPKAGRPRKAAAQTDEQERE